MVSRDDTVPSFETDNPCHPPQTYLEGARMKCDLHGGTEQSIGFRITFGLQELKVCIMCVIRIVNAYQRFLKGDASGFVKEGEDT